jgi:hypothetical protein
MMGPWAAYAVAGAAIAMPTILTEARARGVPVPATFTDGQLAAIQSLTSSAIVGVPAKSDSQNQATTVYLNLMRELVKSKGPAPNRPAGSPVANISPKEAIEISERWIAAVVAGAKSGGDSYKLFDTGSILGDIGLIDDMLEHADTHADDQTALGQALRAVLQNRNIMQNPVVFDGFDEDINAVSTMNAIAHLSIEMDDQGVNVIGNIPGVGDAILDTLTQLPGALLEKGADLASDVSTGLGSALLPSFSFTRIVLLAGAGYLAWKVGVPLVRKAAHV